MAVAHRIESPQIAGELTNFVGVDVPMGVVTDALRMTRLDLRLTDPAAVGGSVVAMVNAAPGGGGSLVLQGTLAAGQRSATITGDILLPAGSTLYLRVVSESGEALGLSASVELSLLEGQTETVSLVSHRAESSQIAGLLSGFVGIDLPFAVMSESVRLTRADFRVTDPPTGGSVVARLVAGSGSLEATIADGQRLVSVTGSVLLGAGDQLALRVVSESGNALGLSVSAELSAPDASSISVYLTSLERVKDSFGITQAGSDAVLLRLIQSVSKGMQMWMARSILQTTTVAERHYPTGLSSAIVLNEGPVTAVAEVRTNGAALDSANYRIDGKRLLRRVAGSRRFNWERDAEIEVDYTAGYLSAPLDLVDAATNEVARAWLASIRGGGDGPHVNSTTPETGDTKTLFQGGWLPMTVEIMRPYRRLV